jgi:hypothetical protein
MTREGAPCPKSGKLRRSQSAIADALKLNAKLTVKFMSDRFQKLQRSPEACARQAAGAVSAARASISRAISRFDGARLINLHASRGLHRR